MKMRAKITSLSVNMTHGDGKIVCHIEGMKNKSAESS
jgi:hypothetical protein